jgi:NhaP-type Na+/H+ or K+/H+ antiporter
MKTIAVFAGLLFFFSLVSRRLQKTIITAPMVFTAGGMVYIFLATELAHVKVSREAIQVMGEIALILLLFSDGTRIRVRRLWVEPRLPVRLLAIGMLLTIIAGTLVATLLFPELILWEAAILATLLAPTDAGLGHAVVNSKQVPEQIREALSVEAGLNDGLSIPFLMIFIALAIGSEEHSGLSFALLQVGLGTGAGLTIGVVGGLSLNWAYRRRYVEPSFESLVLLPLAFIAYLAAESNGGNGFIAAYVAGLYSRKTCPIAGEKVSAFVEAEGQLFTFAVFFILGTRFVPLAPDFSLTHVVFALLSLTAIRMLPVAIALVGTRLQPSSVLFLGWFGPRGLASIVLGLIFLEHAAHTPGMQTIVMSVMMTVILSVFAHGITASPAIGLYAKRIAKLPADAPERMASSDTATR